MTNNIENICYEYSDDCLFSQVADSDGLPFKIIIYLQSEYIIELCGFLAAYGYERTYLKRTGKHFSMIHFDLVNIAGLDDFSIDEANNGRI